MIGGHLRCCALPTLPLEDVREPLDRDSACKVRPSLLSSLTREHLIPMLSRVRDLQAARAGHLTFLQGTARLPSAMRKAVVEFFLLLRSSSGRTTFVSASISCGPAEVLKPKLSPAPTLPQFFD